MSSVQFRFGIFTFDQDSGELRRDGVLIRLQAQPAQVLGCLVERAREVVSRQELRKAVWPDGTFVDFERGLNFCISQVRTALNDTAAEPRYIRTIPKRGYQFIAPVERSVSADSPLGETSRPHAASPFARHLRLAAALLLVSLLAAAAYWIPRWYSGPRLPIVAVARFDNETGDPAMTQFSDAVTDLVVTDLAAKGEGQYRVIGNAGELRVARERRDLKALAASLGASYVVLGQVQHKGDQTRILAHLIHLPDQTHVWVTRIDRTVNDPLAIESQIADMVAEEFSPKIRPAFVPYTSHRRASL